MLKTKTLTVDPNHFRFKELERLKQQVAQNFSV